MSTPKVFVGWQDVESRIEALADALDGAAYDGVFGVPRGGVPPALMLASVLDLPMVKRPTPSSLVVDDLIDSGATMARYPGNHRVALWRKSWSPDVLVAEAETIVADAWIVFPWEPDDAEHGPSDAVVRLLEHVGEDPQRDGLRATPRRVLRALTEMTSGTLDDPAAILSTTFDDTCDEMVVVRNIEFVSVCEHHLLPFTGSADVAYVPNDRIVGLSKLARLVDCFSRRLQVQERMTQQIADAIEKHLQPLGVGVVVRASHGCMACRGVRKPAAVMVTSSMLGVLRDDEKARAEFLALSRQTH